MKSPSWDHLCQRLHTYAFEIRESHELWESSDDGSARLMGRSVMTIGKVLCQVQDELHDSPEGYFGRWLKERLGMSESTAFKCIRAYLVFQAIPRGEGLDDISWQFEAEALFLLSQVGDDVDAARNEALAIAKGRRKPVTANFARGLIDKWAKRHARWDRNMGSDVASMLCLPMDRNLYEPEAEESRPRTLTSDDDEDDSKTPHQFGDYTPSLESWREFDELLRSADDSKGEYLTNAMLNWQVMSVDDKRKFFVWLYRRFKDGLERW